MPRQSDKEYKNKDFTDYFLLFLNTGREKEFFPAFRSLIENSKNIIDAYPEFFDTENILNKEYNQENYETIDFYEAIKEQYINKPICFRAIVRGEAVKPYIYPVRVRVSCDITRGDKCSACGLFLTGGSLELDLKNINPLELIDVSLDSQSRFLKNRIGIIQCSQFKIELLEQRYMQEIFLSPLMEKIKFNVDDKKEQRFIVRHAFSEGSEIIPNRTYKFFSIPVPSPKNQTLLFYIKNHEEEISNLDVFKLTHQDIEDLQIFKVQNENNIEDKLKEIYHDLSVNVSPTIRFREDIMFAIDLIFHSALHFRFGTSFEKGWVEALIVGDTQVGKTKIATKMINHYNLGVIQGAENSTIAGLIGGMTKFESINIMTWGLLPLNHARLVILDEMSGIDKNVFGELTRIRGEGIAERTIVGGSSSTPAKVRLCWLSNPRKRKMSQYDTGCDMIRELVGNDEDISRFDFVLTIRDDEVSAEDINSLRSTGVGSGSWVTKHIYKSELCNKLVMWAWSRKANQIVFDEDTEELILFYALELSKKYTSNFPLVLASTIRLKLARLSIALAARLFSTPENDPEVILVTQFHVKYIYEFLNRIYDKPSFGYGEYSDFFKTGEDKSEDSRNSVINYLQDNVKDMKSFCVNMLTNKIITAIEIRDFSQLSKDKADDLRTKLVSAGFLIKKAGFYVKSDLFRKLLKEELKK